MCRNQNWPVASHRIWSEDLGLAPSCAPDHEPRASAASKHFGPVRRSHFLETRWQASGLGLNATYDGDKKHPSDDHQMMNLSSSVLSLGNPQTSSTTWSPTTTSPVLTTACLRFKEVSDSSPTPNLQLSLGHAKGSSSSSIIIDTALSLSLSPPATTSKLKADDGDDQDEEEEKIIRDEIRKWGSSQMVTGKGMKWG